MINYYLLTKPGIVLGNLVTVAAGFLLASRGSFDVWLFLTTLLGIALIMASACILNNYIDRPLDRKMRRTKERALVTGIISGRNAIALAAFLGILGNLTLIAYTNVLTVCVANFGFFVYVVLYSMWKSRTVYATAIGSVAGAVPPIVGYCAVSNRLDSAALILFAMLVLWQMPHFFSIAMYHFDDYVRADIPALPVRRGALRTKVHMALYITAFLFTSPLLTYFHHTGYVYLGVTVGLSLIWLGLCLTGFSRTNDHLWARSMFRCSLVLIAAICVAIPINAQSS